MGGIGSHRDRARMVERDLAGRGIQDQRVLTAMRQLPRERFVPAELQNYAYEDGPLPIGENQAISQPFIVALMLEAAQIKPDDRVLDVGTGSGYAAAVASLIAGHVYTVERHRSLLETARERFRSLGLANITAKHADGTLGWPEKAPFDAILVAAGGPEVPKAYCNQLSIGGRLVMPVGPRTSQTLVRVVRRAEHEFAETDLGPVAFVPLIGAQGWRAGRRSHQ
jgi:protein-L-isoaspartate(D-aspartate) O-methyltransferase